MFLEDPQDPAGPWRTQVTQVPLDVRHEVLHESYTPSYMCGIYPFTNVDLYILVFVYLHVCLYINNHKYIAICKVTIQSFIGMSIILHPRNHPPLSLVQWCRSLPTFEPERYFFASFTSCGPWCKLIKGGSINGGTHGYP